MRPGCCCSWNGLTIASVAITKKISSLKVIILRKLRYGWKTTCRGMTLRLILKPLMRCLKLVTTTVWSLPRAVTNRIKTLPSRYHRHNCYRDFGRSLKNSKSWNRSWNKQHNSGRWPTSNGSWSERSLKIKNFKPNLLTLRLSKWTMKNLLTLFKT
jgi:hypothetical protein